MDLDFTQCHRAAPQFSRIDYLLDSSSTTMSFDWRKLCRKQYPVAAICFPIKLLMLRGHSLLHC